MADQTIAKVERDIEAEQVKAYFRDAYTLNLAGAAVFSLLVFAVHEHIPRWTWLPALICIYLITGYRIHIFRQYRRAPDSRSSGQWSKTQTLSTAAAGVCWGAANTAMLANLPEDYRPYVLTVATVVAATSSSEGFSLKNPPRFFILTSILPIAIWLLTLGDWTYGVLALMLLVFIVVMQPIINTKNSVFVETQRLRFRNEYLANELKESELQYRTLADSGQALIWTSGKDKLCDYFNKVWLGFTGRSLQQEMGNGWVEGVHPDDLQHCMDVYESSFDARKNFGMDYRLRRHDGEYRWLRDEGCPRYNSDGEFIGYIGYCIDVTDRKTAENALKESEEKLRGLFELSPLGIALTDMNGRYIEFNEAFRAICGYPAEELKTLDYWTLTPKEYAQQETEQLEALAKNGSYGPYIKEYRQKDGSRIPIQLNGTLLHGKDGQQYIWSIAEDITIRNRIDESLRVTASVFSNSQEAILISDADNNIVDVNPAFSKITGYDREEVIGKNPRLLSSGRQDSKFYSSMWQQLTSAGSWRGEIWNRRKSGEVYAEQLSVSVIYDNHGKALRYVAVFSDISHIKEHEAELSRFAYYDTLTGIPNRVLLADRMKQAIAQTAREKNMMAVCYLDLDGFKLINDNLGHDAGDQVLIEVAKRIEDTVRGGDTVARIGGDEFVVLLLGLNGQDECIITLQRLLAAIAQPIFFREETITLGASIGVSMYPINSSDSERLLKYADQAMYAAKKSGKNRYRFYNPVSVS